MSNINRLINLPSFESGFLESIVNNIRSVDQLKLHKSNHYEIDFNQVVFFGKLIRFEKNNEKIWIKGKDKFYILPTNKGTVIDSYTVAYKPLIKTDILTIDHLESPDTILDILIYQSMFLGFWLPTDVLERINYIFATKGIKIRFENEKITPELILKIEKCLSRETKIVFDKFFNNKNLNELLPLINCKYNYTKEEIDL